MHPRIPTFPAAVAAKAAAVAAAVSLLLSGTPLAGALAPDTVPSYYHAAGSRLESLVSADKAFTIPAEDICLTEEASGVTLAEGPGPEGTSVPLLQIGKGARLSFDVDCPAAGGYILTLSYIVTEESTEDVSFSLKIGGEYPFSDSREITLPSVWADDSQDYKLDRFNNEVYPLPVHTPAWQSKALNSSVYHLDIPLVFPLKEGVNRIDLEFGTVPCRISGISFGGYAAPEPYASYAAGAASKESGVTAETEPILLEGEKYTSKSHSYIRGEKTRNYNCTPYAPDSSRINLLSGYTWATPGNAVSYTFRAEQSGVYYLALRYSQSEKTNMPVFKNLYVDGRPLFGEMQSYAFPYTGSGIKTHTVSVDGSPAGLYLEAGEHTLTLESSASPLYETFEQLQDVVNEINRIALEVKKVTGNKIDKNRDWKLEEFLPDIRSELYAIADQVNTAYAVISGMASKQTISAVSDLKVAAATLTRYAEDLEYFVNNISRFSQGSGSVAERVSTLMDGLLDQPMDIDQILLSPRADDLEHHGTGFFEAVWKQIQKLFYTFVADYDTAGQTSEEELNVWVGRSTFHIEALRELADRRYTGGKVNFSIMADEQKLIFAQSAGTGPDVVLGTTTFRPFDFALRGALYDLRQFPDFGSFIRDFHSEMLVMFSIGDQCFGLPETANFVVQFYRKDILASLGLEVPETWDDVLAMLPVLSRYGMSYNTYLSNLESFKHFGATMPFINQYGGKLYSEDGSRVELGDPDTVAAFTLMTDLYTRYSLPASIPNFYNNFKKGISPIGMSDISTYILLKNAAPEIKGQWGIAPSVGVRDENGDINRSQLSVMNGCVLMQDSDKHEEGWDFLKWWMSEDTQVEYTREMYLRNGPEYIWNTANLKALAKSTAFEPEDLQIILEQIDQTVEVPRNPAYFAVERELSNAWNRVVYSGDTPRASLDKAILTCNRQIAQKLQEFGYMDDKGNLIKEFKVVTGEDVDRWKEE